MMRRMTIFGLCAAALSLAQEVKERTERRREVRVETFEHAVPGPGAMAGLDSSAKVHFAAAATGAGKAVAGAPYSAEGITDYVRTLADGTRITRRTTAKFARDGQGRTREEQTLPGLGPWASGDGSKMVTITDPVAKEVYILNEKDKTARKIKLPSSGAAGAPAAGRVVTMRTERRVEVIHSGPGAAAGTFAASAIPADVIMQRGEGKTEQLGTQTMEGLQATGTRRTRTVPAGEMGNDRPIVSTTESWESTELKTIVRSISHDPEFGDTNYRLTGITRAEPAKSLFQVPADYKVEEGPAVFQFFRSEVK